MSDVIDAPVGEAVKALVNHMADASGYDVAYDDVRELQVAAMNERLQQRVDRIRLVKLRADDAGISEIRKLEDVVPLLLPHTAYKSYPESFLAQKKWDRLTKWLSTVSTPSLDDVNLDGINDIDEWVERLADAGHFLSCSSGTTGNPALLLSSRADAEFSSRELVNGVLWGSEIRPAQDRTMFGFAMVTKTPKRNIQNVGLAEAFANPDGHHFAFPVPPATVGSITRMICLRKAIADGSAKPGEIAEYEAETALRQRAVEEAVAKSADAIIAARGEKLHISGMWAQIYAVAEEVRNRGYSGKDFNPENSAFLAGGLKRAQVPDNYREFVFETFNLSPPFIFHLYSMQEIQTAMVRCQEGGRYHIPAWVVCLPLDKEGETLVPGVGEGAVEGRAAFFDLSIEGRWGGIISGDHIHVDYGPCACGSKSPSIRDDIYRYADLKGDDKITCSGTIDAYVRGMT